MQRNTIQRQIIMNILQKMEHPSVLDVNDEVRKHHPTISKTTVYRNLRLLDQEKVICQIWVQGDVERYDTNLTPHYHFKCKVCENIFDMELEYLHGFTEAVHSIHPHQIESHNISFTGICVHCS